MALVLKNDVLYLHVPKTGGNWLTATLEAEDLVVGKISHKHATWDYVVNARDKERGWFGRVTGARQQLSRSPQVFCVVRHPLSWYESWWKYQNGKAWRDWGTAGHLGDWHVCAALNAAKSPDFMDFMRSVNLHCPGFASQMFARYTQGSGAIVLRNETLAEDFVALAEKVGWKIDPVRVLGSGRLGMSPNLPTEWDPDVRAETLANEHIGLRLYGYAASGIAASV